MKKYVTNVKYLSTSIVIREKQIKTTKSYHFSVLQMVTTKSKNSGTLVHECVCFNLVCNTKIQENFILVCKLCIR